ncbi:MAG TPA: hypothetical protein VGA16_01385 [Candidatus Limnocylindria bacterium]
MDSATLRGARVVGVLCALLLIAPIVVSLAFPTAFFFPPYHAAYQRMLGALLLALALGLLLALRDPSRNAGVYAVIGLAVGSLMAAIAYTLVAEGADPVHWFTQVPLLAAVSVTLVVTYTRLRRPHPVIVRIVTAAVLLLPFGLYLYDLAYKAFVAR